MGHLFSSPRHRLGRGRYFPLRLLCFAALISLLAGCGGGGAPEVSVDPIDVSAVTDAAFQSATTLPNKPQSGTPATGTPQSAAVTGVSPNEASPNPTASAGPSSNQPEMRVFAATADTDGDGVVTRAEFQARLQRVASVTSGLQGVIGMVTLNNRPLTNATVTFQPAAFMGASRSAASGSTDEEGMFELHTTGQSLPGIGGGVYRVIVSRLDENGNETIPARYNTATELGAEVSADLPSHFEFKLH